MKHLGYRGNPRGQPRPASIELTIDELVLFGFSPGDRHRISDAAERELTRLLKERGIPEIPALGSDRAVLDCGHFRAGPRAKAETIAAQVAEAVYGGLKRWT